MKIWAYIDLIHRLETIDEDRLEIRRLYFRKRRRLTEQQAQSMLTKLYPVLGRCAAIVDYLRNDFPNNDRDEQQLEIWAIAERQLRLIRWLEDRLEEECTDHDFVPEIVFTPKGREKTILACTKCGKEVRILTQALIEKYNIKPEN
ncbi:hypothetical protein AWW68_18900 [Roseivirga spongicola]|uniref:Uncharacterized protein n=1 Tax=Roseivirga spongicola TaxID=333140 RepID=A0A150XDY4_9BACT|nr:hypothetical protein [Roseivirga spongicola]KYG76927.1 hypothetical protein AWW68_18900 [Roseivirga spongicola]